MADSTISDSTDSDHAESGNTMPAQTRVFYRTSPEGVVVEKEGKLIAVYRSPEEMIEVHIKGLLARDQQDTKRIKNIYRDPRPKKS